MWLGLYLAMILSALYAMYAYGDKILTMIGFRR
jgi:hypothetical protein